MTATHFKFRSIVEMQISKGLPSSIPFTLKRLWILFFTGVLILSSSTALFCAPQSSKLDSIHRIWLDESQSDSIRVGAFYDYINKGYFFSNSDTILPLSDELHAYAKAHNYQRANAFGFEWKGYYWMGKDDYPKSLDAFEKALKVYRETGRQKGLAKMLNLVGTVHRLQGNYPKALDCMKQSLKKYELIGNQQRMIYSLGNIGITYSQQGDYVNALIHFERALKISEQLGDQRSIGQLLGDISTIYSEQNENAKALEYLERDLEIATEIGEDQRRISQTLNNIGLVYLDQENNPRALEYLERSLEIRLKMEDQRGVAITQMNIALVYYKLGEVRRAFDFYQRSLALAIEVGDKNTEAKTMARMGDSYLELGNFSKSLEYCTKAYELYKEIGAKAGEKQTCSCLYDTYKSLGNCSEALLFLEELQILEVDLNETETAKKLQQMEFSKIMLQDSIVKSEEARRVEQVHNEELRHEERSRNIAFSLGGLLLILAAGLYARVRYIRKSRSILQIEKDRSESLLLNILPEEIAQELKEKGKADARDFDLVSILFTDFKGFTAASAKLSAQDLVSEINVCFEAFDGIMGKYNIEKIKTIGDAYMAAGGLPVPTNDSVKKTVLAALEMQEFISKRKVQNDADDKPAFEMRVGVHTGPVVAGIVGVKKFQYDIWGDTVNTASRMESNGEVDKVNISQATYELLKLEPEFAFESRGKIEVKGKGEMEMWFVSVKSEE